MTELLFADASWDAEQHVDDGTHDASGEMGDDTPSESADASDLEFAPPPQGFRLTTAAAMIEPTTTATASVAKPAVPPDAFQQGMVVRHPDYGLGKITAIDGQGAKRAATVLFASAAGEKRFYLIHSRLTPAKTG
jgi:hypothetical protein